MHLQFGGSQVVYAKWSINPSNGGETAEVLMRSFSGRWIGRDHDARFKAITGLTTEHLHPRFETIIQSLRYLSNSHNHVM